MNSREKAFNKILSKISECVSHGAVTTKRPGVRKILSSIPGTTCFFFFSCFLFFSFPLRLVFILVFVVFFYLFIWLMFFFRFINFLSYCFTSTSGRSPESFARSCDSRISS